MNGLQMTMNDGVVSIAITGKLYVPKHNQHTQGRGRPSQ